jgi:hypothetical protein
VLQFDLLPVAALESFFHTNAERRKFSRAAGQRTGIAGALGLCEALEW